MLDEVLERLIGQLRLIGPGSVAEGAGETIRIRALDGAKCVQQCSADIAGGAADIRPVRSVGNCETVVGRSARVRLVAGLRERSLILLVPYVGEALEEEQREHVLLV